MSKGSPKTHRLLSLDTHYRVIISVVIAVIVFFSTKNSFVSSSTGILLTWNGFSLSAIIMDWIIILRAHPQDFKQCNTLDDSSRTMIFVTVIIASFISLFAIIFLLRTEKGATRAETDLHVLLVIASVITSWFLVHTIFTFRYAHMYYDTDNDDGSKKKIGGLQFPGNEKDPDFMDFVYFSFVLGMTFQVSDVEISDRQIRRVAWLHGMISFAYNTAIVALSINIISGLVGH